MKLGSSFTDIFRNKCTYFYQDTFRFDISIAHCLGGYFFRGHSVQCWSARWGHSQC